VQINTYASSAYLYSLSNLKCLIFQSAETLSLVKQDLSEFVTTIQHDTTVTVAETASNVKDKLKVYFTNSEL
jgi:hypothetical protein